VDGLKLGKFELSSRETQLHPGGLNGPFYRAPACGVVNGVYEVVEVVDGEDLVLSWSNT
jgi:hypothetical protein